MAEGADVEEEINYLRTVSALQQKLSNNVFMHTNNNEVFWQKRVKFFSLVFNRKRLNSKLITIANTI